MVRAALTALSEVDLVLYLAEAGWPSGDEDPAKIDPIGPFHREVLAEVQRSGKPVILVLTKIDLIPKPLLLPLMQAWGKEYPFKDIYPLSAVTGENVEKFVDVVRAALPEGPPLFPPETVTDQAERALCAEFIREQIFLQTRDEIPYGAAVTIDEFDESDRPQEGEGKPGAGLVRIAASIMVSRDSHKGIIIGHRGERLKEIGTAARKSIEALLGCKVWLDLHVRVVVDWTEKPAMLHELGFQLK
jgi:GTP-binding protein Era